MLKVEYSSPLPAGPVHNFHYHQLLPQHHHHHHHHQQQQQQQQQQPLRQARSRSAQFTFPDVAPVAPKRPSDGPHSLESPAKKQSKWSASENAVIIELRAGGMKWEDISKKLPGRSAISCRLHYQNFLERKPEWDEEKKNKLARLYERFKDNMWKDVAKELQMPWRAVEAMHWQIGAQGMADRAGVAVFSTHNQSAPQPVKAESEAPSRLAPSHLVPTPHPQHRHQTSNSPLPQPDPHSHGTPQPPPIQPAYYAGAGTPRQAPLQHQHHHHQLQHQLHHHQQQQHPYPQQPPPPPPQQQQQQHPEMLARQDSLLAPKIPPPALPSRLSPHAPDIRPHQLSRHLSQPDLSKSYDRDYRPPPPLLNSEPIQRPSPTLRPSLLPAAGPHMSRYDGPRLPPLTRPTAAADDGYNDTNDDRGSSGPRLPPLRISTSDMSSATPGQLSGSNPDEPRSRSGDVYWRAEPRLAEPLHPHVLPPPPPPPSSSHLQQAHAATPTSAPATGEAAERRAP